LKYLLDVNALIALGFDAHQFHGRIWSWLAKEASPSLATCSIVELGYVRILSKSPAYSSDVSSAKSSLRRLKETLPWSVEFIGDHDDATLLPAWVVGPNQVTDGHLLELASKNNAVLATFDRGIPGAFLIP